MLGYYCLLKIKPTGCPLNLMTNSFVPGLEMLANKFNVITGSIKKRPYDFLDQRKMEFDQDYDDFKRQISDLHVSPSLCPWEGLKTFALWF